MTLETGNFVAWLIWYIVPMLLVGCFIVSLLQCVIGKDEAPPTGDTTPAETFHRYDNHHEGERV